MNDLFETLPFRPADILLPKDCEYSKWSVVACDQYTSQPEYWQRVEEYVGRSPSTLRLILPESCLEGPNVETDIMEINNTMSRYLREGRFVEHPNTLFYVERTLDNGKVRRGLMGMVDLEQYDYEPGSSAPIRATEGTVLSRIPPRVAVRKNAPVELPHVMLLVDDPGQTVIEPLADQADSMQVLDGAVTAANYRAATEVTFKTENVKDELVIPVQISLPVSTDNPDQLRLYKGDNLDEVPIILADGYVRFAVADLSETYVLAEANLLGEVTVNDKTVTVIAQAPTGTTLYAASYDEGGRMRDVATAPVAEGQISYTLSLTPGTSVRVFLLDDNQMPLCQTKVIEKS